MFKAKDTPTDDFMMADNSVTHNKNNTTKTAEISKKSRQELEKTTVEISKDLCKYQLTFPEMVIALSWILESYGSRVLKTGDPNLTDINQQKLL